MGFGQWVEITYKRIAIALPRPVLLRAVRVRVVDKDVLRSIPSIVI